MCGSPRLFPVTDRTLKAEVIANVKSRDHTNTPTRFRDGDERYVRGNEMLAVNVRGRQCLLFLTSFGGRATTFLVHMPSQAVDVLPLRFNEQRHEDDTLIKCTFSPANRALVLDDMCSDEPLRSRVDDLHRLVHEDHTPDALLFPLRVVTRRFHALDQIDEVKSILSRGDIVVHSVSVLDDAREKRILAQDDSARASSGPRAHYQNNQVMYASIARSTEPDSYHVTVDGGNTWEFLGVKTIVESRTLDASIPSDKFSTACVVYRDGPCWRFQGLAPDANVDQFQR